MRVAAADIGTNTTRLLVADVGSGGTVAEVERLTEITRLGEGVDASGALAEGPMGRVTSALAHYAERARAHHAERLLAVATSATRDAANRDDFLARVAATGFEPRLFSGDDEAITAFAGVCSRAPGEEALPADGSLVVDIGGGSTELVVGSSEGVAWSRSLQAGSVRMTERFLGEDVVAERDVAACSRAVEELLQVVPAEVVQGTRRVIAVAGTATTLAAIANGAYDPDAVHLARITRAQTRSIQEQLGALPLEERRRIPGLEAKRAPVIVAGLVVLGCVLDYFGQAGALVSERDILHGTALLAAGVSLGR